MLATFSSSSFTSSEAVASLVGVSSVSVCSSSCVGKFSCTGTIPSASIFSLGLSSGRGGGSGSFEVIVSTFYS